MLKITDLTKIYKNGCGIRGLNLQVEAGMTYGLLGPNGSGKTTTLKLIAGLILRDSGSIELMELETAENFEQAMRQTGFVFESAVHYGNLSAYDNMLMVARYYPEIPRSRIDELLDIVGVYDMREEKTESFSLGMCQRLALAQAMYGYPKLMVMDEPFNGLDIQGMIDIRKIIASLVREGTSFLISSHLADEIEKICTKAGIILNGQLICEDTMEEILKNHTSIEGYYIAKTKEARHAAI